MEQNKALYPGEIRLFCRSGIVFQVKDFSDLVKQFFGGRCSGFHVALARGRNVKFIPTSGSFLTHYHGCR